VKKEGKRLQSLKGMLLFAKHDIFGFLVRNMRIIYTYSSVRAAFDSTLLDKIKRGFTRLSFCS